VSGNQGNVLERCKLEKIAGFPLTWKVQELIWSGKVGEFCWWKIMCIVQLR